MKLLSKRRNLNSATASPADTAGLASFVGPAAVENMPRHIKIGDGYAATLIVTGYPAEVAGAWLDPLLAWPGRLDVVVYIDPLAPQVAAARLRRQRARFESNRRGDAEKGRLADPMTEAAADDAAELADRIARGQAKLFRVGLYLCVHAPTLAELEEAVAHVRATAASVLLDTQPATWRQLQGWLATLPLASDGLGMRRVMDTDAIATASPSRRRTSRRRCRERPARPAACSTASTRTATAWSGGTDGANTTPTASSSPARVRARATSSSSKCCAASPTVCTSR